MSLRVRQTTSALVRRSLASAVDDTTAERIVGGDRDGHFVPEHDLDAEPSHLPREVREHDVIFIYLDAEEPAREDLDDFALKFN